jgi:hypothetical protein
MTTLYYEYARAQICTNHAPFVNERISFMPLKITEIIDLRMEEFTSLICHCFKISHPHAPLP